MQALSKDKDSPPHNLPDNRPAFELLAESIQDGLLLVDPEWKITYSNRSAQQLLRRPGTELFNCSLWDLIKTDPNTTAQHQLARAVKEQVTVELDVFHPNLFTWHEVRAVPSPQGLILTLRDITDREWLIHREAEKTFLRHTFMEAPVPITVMRGPHHLFQFVNNEAKKLIGGRDVEGLTVREAFPEVVEQGFVEILDNVYRTGENYVAKQQTVRFDRHGTGVLEEACFDMSYQALRGFNGEVSGIINIVIEK
jgi:transcriptional regulator with PAS, ATPase and Fis domain